MSKNLILEELQKVYKNPTKGTHYFEEVNRIGGVDHQPIFGAYVKVPSFNGNKSIEVTKKGEIGESKKTLLRDTWGEVWSLLCKNEIEDDYETLKEKEETLIFGEEDE